MSKTTYRLTDGYGNFALVDGAEERDRWTPRGWTVTDAEPAADQWVWTRHEVHGGHAKFPPGVLQQMAALGWQPSPPPEPVDLLHDPALVDVDAQASRTSSAAAPAAKTTTKAASGETKE